MPYATKDISEWWTHDGPLFRQTKKPQLKVVPYSTTRWSSAKRRAKRNGTYTGGKFRSKVY